MTRHEACVVGAGLIGSAAAKYLTMAGIRTCLIGPSKSAKQVQDTQEREIFDSWGDVSRISHTLFTDAVWAQLATDSIKRYRSLEEESGVQFFTDTGYLVLSDSSSYVKESADIARQVGVTSLEFYNDKAEIEKRFPVLQFSAGARVIGVSEPNNAGLVNPVKLVDAQRALFARHGGTMLDDVAIRIHRDSEAVPFDVETQNGSIIQADKVLICAGAFLGHNKLLPENCQLDIYYRPSLSFRIRIDPGPPLDSLFKSPPLIFIYGTPAANGKASGSSIYTAPPIRYPDGNYYLKIGYLDDTSKFENRTLDSPDAVSDIYRSNVAENEEVQANGRHLVSIAEGLFKGLLRNDFVADTCCWVNTPSGRPYVGSVAPGWFVVTGDNGFAAKSSDEIGRLASELVSKGKWSSSCLTEDDLRVKILH